ncbi:sulfate ABC transporter substrate-binding protein, partial [Burkholderia gladioli]|nr:sulfate ABC transporter substrate-binding protein [Burkholderia gladioli]
FKALKTFSVEQVFGSWANAQKTHFADGGTFDQVIVDRK